mgnify:CR=1 FL=1
MKKEYLDTSAVTGAMEETTGKKLSSAESALVALMKALADKAYERGFADGKKAVQA